jgi:hypothetical protein
MNTQPTPFKQLLSRKRAMAAVALSAAAVVGPLGLAAHADAAPKAPSAAAKPTATAVASTVVYQRFEQIINRWAVNTGFDNGDKTSGANAQTWSWTHRDPHDWNSQWDYEYQGNGYWTYRNRWSDKCLGVESLTYSARVEQQTCNGSDGQKWDEIYVGSHNGRSTFVVKNKAVSEKLFTDMVMEADHTGFGAPVRVNVRNDFSTQRWFFSYVYSS